MKNRLKELLEEKKWSPYRLIKSSGVTNQTIYTIVNNPDYLPSMETLTSICDTLECQPNDVIYWVKPINTCVESNQ